MRFFSSRIIIAVAVLVLLVIAVFVGVNLIKNTQNLKSRADYSSPLKATGVSNIAFDYSNMRGVMLYLTEDIPSDSYISKLQKELPAMKFFGFNTVGIFPYWAWFQPQALPTPTWNEANIAKFRQILQILKDNNMRAAFYISSVSPSTTPTGISGCPWDKPHELAAHDKFTSDFLRKIEDFNDIVYPMLYTEASWLCAAEYADQLAMVKSGMGDWPNRLPRDIRNKFRLGIHDANFINVNGSNFMPNPNPYDFISLTNYSKTDDMVYVDEFNLGRVRYFYPDIPIIFYEMGFNACGWSPDAQHTQGERFRLSTNVLMDRRVGFNIWSWIDNTPAGCGGDNSNGGIVKTQNSEPLEAAYTLKSTFELRNAKPWPASINSPAPSPVPSANVKLKKGDTNNDGVVNSIDFSYLKLRFNTGDQKADLNKNGQVDYPDYSILFSNWGR